MWRVVLATAVLAVLAGCGQSDDGKGELDVVATTTQAADFSRAVGGDRADVHGLLRAGGDPHDYEPRPSDVRELSEADVVVRSGGEVDEWLDDLLDEAGEPSEKVTLLDAAGGEDPHWWQDPRAAEAAVAAIGAALSKADPAGRAGYERRAERYRRRVRRLDREIAACIRLVPAERRKLVTSHDALGRFGERYGIEVVGTLIPARTTQAQPSVREVDRLVERIREERVEAIFPETALNPKLERAVARESGAKVARRLYADALGPSGSDGDTYLKAMATNTDVLVDGMTGGRRSCRPRVAG